jgi:hypothetical protein
MKNFKKSVKYFFVCLAVLIGLAFSSQAAEVAGSPRVRVDRPRVLIDIKDVRRIRQEIRSLSKLNFNRVHKYVADSVKKVTPDQIRKLKYNIRIVVPVAFVGLLLENDQYIKRAIAYATALADMAREGDDTAQGERTFSMACTYDWLYRYMTPNQRQIIRQGLLAHIDQFRGVLAKPLYTGGHSRMNLSMMLAGLIAVYDKGIPADGDWLLRRLQKVWEEGFNTFQQYVAVDGGYHMGWKYGGHYTSPEAYLLWEKAIGGRWGQAWRVQQVYWYLYGIRGDGTVPRSGDYGNTRLADPYSTAIMAVCAGVLKNPHAEWFYRAYFGKAWAPYQIYRLIYRNFGLKPLAPDDQSKPLPLSKHFRNAGVVLAKDSWQSNSTQLLFKSTNFYSRAHQHKDQNHISIAYKGSLLIDSGRYEWGSSHWKNYYTRTIAHNTLVVFDPKERFISYGRKLSNDGGQKYPGILTSPAGQEPRDLTAVQSDKYRFDGIQGFDYKKGIVWARGDASRAYNSKKVKRFLRDIIMVNRPLGRSQPIFLVVDRVKLTSPQFVPRILFHANDTPKISGKSFSISNSGGGYLHGLILAPASAALDLIGGSGKEWWVNGKNYPPSRSRKDKGVDAGQWRIEVRPQKNSTEVTFVTLLAVDDLGRMEGLPKAVVISDPNFVGVKFKQTMILVNLSPKPQSKWVINGSGLNKLGQIVLAGVFKDSFKSVKINAQTVSADDPRLILLNR